MSNFFSKDFTTKLMMCAKQQVWLTVENLVSVSSNQLTIASLFDALSQVMDRILSSMPKSWRTPANTATRFMPVWDQGKHSVATTSHC